MAFVKGILGPRRIPFGQNLKIGEELVDEPNPPTTVFAKMINGGFVMDYGGEEFVATSVEEAADTIKKWFESSQKKLHKMDK